ncbi:GNAT family N-acetyltransferase [Microbulbifer aggregans]|uniref:GNAT family N-acetyltransferase n=1 Tax=Microbulbifer aggregans TaxID=1769779 RepID=UPI001CFCF2AA|nr:GNAT family N-acetyltransferase [Microbulbifer aggregans]
MESISVTGGISHLPLRDEELDKANIENLTSLWRAAGAKQVPDTGAATLYACDRWPNRHWFEEDTVLPGQETLQNIVRRLPAEAMVPVWKAAPNLEAALLDSGFQPCLEQRAMHLDLGRWPTTATDATLVLRPVQTRAEIETWVTVCSEAFGYAIDDTVITNLAAHREVNLWLAVRDNTAVGTALLFRTGEGIGIHQVGVPDRFRGQGIARTLMQLLLNLCQQSGARYVTLQASQMGEGLYRQLGFEPRFGITSYRRP